MKAKELTIFREALRCLPFNGIRIKEFGERIHVRPHTLYNYISGQIHLSRITAIFCIHWKGTAPPPYCKPER